MLRLADGDLIGLVKASIQIDLEQPLGYVGAQLDSRGEGDIGRQQKDCRQNQDSVSNDGSLFGRRCC
jgi:hypothetical protein